MSLSKIRRIDDNYRRDSFDERVCYDLSEVLLQFLPIEDKFKFESVSKQFQRTVFERHSELDLSLFISNELLSIRFNNLNKLRITLIDSEESQQIFENNFKQLIENNKRLTHLHIDMDFNKNQFGHSLQTHDTIESIGLS